MRRVGRSNHYGLSRISPRVLRRCLINAENLITAILVHLEQPQDLIARAEKVQVPQVSQRALGSFERKYVLLGQALAHKKLIEFITRLKDSIATEKQEKSAAKGTEEPALGESQYKMPDENMIRRQSQHPSTFDQATSQGGIQKRDYKKKKNKNLKERLDDVLQAISEEEVAWQTPNGVLAAERGQFIVGDKVAIGNHADILKILVMWLVDNRPEVLKSAVEGIANMVREGANFRL